MTRRDWWLGVALVTCAVLVHALFPRYEWREMRGGTGSAIGMIKIDTWRGTTRLVFPPPRAASPTVNSAPPTFPPRDPLAEQFGGVPVQPAR